MSAQRRIAALVALACLGVPALAQEAFTLTGVGGREAPVTFTIVDRSNVVDCQTPRPTWMRCMLFDTDAQAEVTDAYTQQLTAQGLELTPNYAGAAQGLLMFRRPSETPCPPVVLILPHSGEGYANAAVPEGKVFRMISYAPDLLCGMGQRPR